ncbi:MAG: glycosyltransferase [Paludibacteraceae bacterium]|nr:glycosyltransferase [Paludibacteraceae bacterium]
MKILILSNCYTRPNFNARLRYQCEYLTRQGHQISVFTEAWDPITFEHSYPITELGFYHLGYITWALKSLITAMTNSKERSLARRVMRCIRNQHFDAILCSTNSYSPMGAAKIIADKLHLPLHIDMWELEELVPGEPVSYQRQWRFKSFRKWNKSTRLRRRNEVLVAANSITTISPEHVKQIRPFNDNVTLIYNGFNPNQYSRQDVHTDAFRINYLGRLYNQQQPDLVMKAIQQLQSELPKLQASFYTNSSAYFRLGYNDIHIHGFLPKEILNDTIRHTSIILLFDDPFVSGMQNVKFYETLGCEKPVLYTPTTKGLLPDVIRLTNAGLCTDNIEEIKTFIRDKYEEWKTNGFTHQPVQHKDLFDSHKQAQQLEQLLSQLIQ